MPYAAMCTSIGALPLPRIQQVISSPMTKSGVSGCFDRNSRQPSMLS
jgi:hypothetical protein